MDSKKKFIVSLVLLCAFTVFAIVNLVFGFLDVAGVFTLNKTVSVCFNIINFVGFGTVCFFAGKNSEVFKLEVLKKDE